MNQWVFGQAFNETPDGSTTDFTTQDAFVAGQIVVFQGGIRVDPTAFFELDTETLRFLDPTTYATATANASTDVLTSASHGRSNGDRVTFSATETLPGGLSLSVKYYVVNKTDDTFQVSLTLGGSAVDLTSVESGTLAFGVPEAPELANGSLYYDAYIGTGSALSPIGLWDVDDFEVYYGLSALSSTVLAAVLTRADYRIQGYLTTAVYTDAIADSPTDVPRSDLIKYTVGDLALFYLQQQGMTTGSVKSYSESYAGIKKYSEAYATGGVQVGWTEAGILARLEEWASDSLSYTVGVEWNTEITFDNENPWDMEADG